jgi:peptide methionine sulfoxide reductase msrA/msrB
LDLRCKENGNPPSVQEKKKQMNLKRPAGAFATVFILSIALTSCAQSVPQEKNETPMKFDVTKTEDEWKKTLTPDQYYVLREKGTERPYSGKLLMNKQAGKYVCAACGNVLFDSDAKFDSHCGWPSFDREIAEGRIVTQTDSSHGMIRTEIMCARCGGHLGHVFSDGPTDTGLRYCVNSESLGFVPAGEGGQDNVATGPAGTDTITLAGGCFWCIETIFQEVKGVISAESGYSGGHIKNPAYREVCNGNTGHAEVVQVVYRPSEVSLQQLLKVFFTVHDPTTLNRQGADVGTQYRSAIFYRNDMQKQAAEEIISALNREKVYDDPIVTEVTPFKAFYKAEDYHQDYYNNNADQPYCRLVIQPKKEKFEKVFKELMK